MNDEQKNEYGLLIAKKSEKLVTALYLVTDLLGDYEPIKSSLRKTAITLLSSMNTLAQPEVKDRITEYKMSLKSVTEILALLHVARTTGIVSDMNSTLLIDGYRSLQMILENKQPVLTEEMLTIDNEYKLQEGESFSTGIGSSSYDALTPRALGRNVIQIEKQTNRVETATHTLPAKEPKEASYEKRTLAESPSKGQYSAERAQRSAKEEEVNKGHNAAPVRHTPMLTSYQQRKVSRRDQILGLFIKGVDVSIKDIATRIKGCSEKTIQRELNALVFDNKIVRIGEKRWSRYLLK